MRPSAAICSLILLAACTPPAPPAIAVKDWPRDEQIEIAREHDLLADSLLNCEIDGKPVGFPLAATVFDDWEMMRREIRK